MNNALPRMTVSANAPIRAGDGMWALVKDGSALIGVGGVVAGGFGGEFLKSMMTNEPKGQVWFGIAFAVGLVMLLAGFAQRYWRRRRPQVGIVVTAADSVADARQREQQAEAFSNTECVLTLKVSVDLPSDASERSTLMNALVEETVHAITTAQRLAPSATQIDIIPTMRLHAGFWFGTRLGYTYAQELAVYSIRQGTGDPPFFHATSLRTSNDRRPPRKALLNVAMPETVPGGDATQTALALDLQGRGVSFHDQVLTDCRRRGIGTLVLVSSPNQVLPETPKAFTAVTDQVCRAWRDAALSPAARNGQHTIYLSGPVAIAVALGARLAAPQPNRWTALSYDRDSSTYEVFP